MVKVWLKSGNTPVNVWLRSGNTPVNVWLPFGESREALFSFPRAGVCEGKMDAALQEYAIFLTNRLKNCT